MLVWIAVDSRSFVPDLVNPGDKVTITLNPLKDGRHAGLLQQVFGADGKPLAHKSRSETERPGLE